jgi:hypothetical protein
MLSAKGYGGQLSFDGSFVTVTSKGFFGRPAPHGQGEKRIPIASVNAVRWKPAGLVVNGYLALTLAGDLEKQSGSGAQTHKAGQNVNSVVFTKKHQREFEQIRDEIEAAIAARRAPSRDRPAPQRSRRRRRR